jgi:hypothetical protein
MKLAEYIPRLTAGMNPVGRSQTCPRASRAGFCDRNVPGGQRKNSLSGENSSSSQTLEVLIMAKHDVLIGQIDYSVLVFIRDSTSSSGAPKTGLDNTKVDFSYTRVEVDNDVILNIVAPQPLTTLTDAHLDWGFKEVNATEAPGLYRLDIADAVFASGAWSAVVFIRDAGSNNVAPVALEFQLVAQNPLNATQNANVVQFGGSNGAFSSGRPEVILGNVAHGGTSATLSLQRVDIVKTTGEAVVITGADGVNAVSIEGGSCGLYATARDNTSFGAAFTTQGTSGTGIYAEGSVAGFWVAGGILGDLTGNVTGSVGSVASGGITNASLATSAVDKVADGVWDEDIVNAGHLEANKAGRALNTLSTLSNRTNSPTLNAVLGVPDAAGANVADAIWDEDVVNAHAEADKAGRCLRTLDAISDRTNNANLNALLGVADSAGTNMADAVWDENIVAAHTGTDTAGRSLRTLDAISDRANNSNLNALLGVADSAGANVADAIWDENIVAAHTGTDTAGRSLRTLDAISDRANNSNLNALLGVTDAAGKNVADMVWDELRSDHTSAGSFGQGVASVQGPVTGAVGSVPWNPAWDAEVESEVADALAAVGLTTTVTGRIDAAISTRATPAQVNTEMLDVISVDTPIDGRSIESALEIIGAAVAGRVTGAGSGTETFKGFDETTTRIVVSCDANGNRNDVVYS